MATEKTVKHVHKLYNDEVEITFYPNSHRYKKAGEKTYLLSVTTITGVIDKSRQLIIWATRLARDYVKNYVADRIESQGEQAMFSSFEINEIADEACDQHNKVKDKAASIGSIVHEFAEEWGKFQIGITKEQPSVKSIVTKKAKEEKLELDDETVESISNGINAFLNWFESADVKYEHVEKLLYSIKHDYAGLTDGVGVVNSQHVIIDYKTSKAIYDDQILQLSAYFMAYQEEFNCKLDGGYILHFCKLTGEFKDHFYTREELEEAFEAFANACSLKKYLKKIAKKNYVKKPSKKEVAEKKEA